MPLKLKQSIDKTEKEWCSRLQYRLEILFSCVWMPSHGVEHHLRVWAFAKELLLLFVSAVENMSEEFVEALIVAVFFHDAGLTKTIGPEHGAAGSKLAEKFIKNQSENWKNRHTQEMLQAIVKHDDKTYAQASPWNSYVGIYELLAIADDLDALGCLGLTRYFEIYFQREMTENEITAEILSNINSRFNFISQWIYRADTVYLKHKQRYEKAIGFLEELKGKEIEILKNMFSQHINPLDINVNLIDNKILREFISDAQKENEEIFTRYNFI